MKKRVIVLMLAAVMALQLGACGAKEEPAAESVAESVSEVAEEPVAESSVAEEEAPVEEELDVIGTEAEDALSTKITNELGQAIKEISVKITGEKFGDSIMAEGQTLEDQASALLCWTPEKKDAEEAEEAADGPAIKDTYMLKVVLADDTKLTFSVFPMDDMDSCVLKVEDKVPYIEYKSLTTEEEVNTLEAEKAYKEEQAKKKAEKKAKEEAEKKAKEEAEAKAAAEAAAAQAAAEAQAQAEAQAAAEAAAAQAAAEAAAQQAAAEAAAQAAAQQAAAEAAAQAAAQQAAQQAQQPQVRPGCLDF